MPTYAIGDVHGCYDQLQQLLVKINYNQQQDILWFTGDLINGGPKPLETLEFIKSLGERAICVLGNHDLVLLGIAAGKLTPPNDRKVGFEPILHAKNSQELFEWLSTKPFIHYDSKFNALLVHAGVLPSWDLAKIQILAKELENKLKNSAHNNFFSEIYGNYPDTWNESLDGWDRDRFVANCFTRMRFCNASGTLELKSKGIISQIPSGYFPWFKVENRKTTEINIIFGHWAALDGKANTPKIFAIDTGCVWGRSLSALRLDDWQLFSVENS